MTHSELIPNLILPVGTHVVTRLAWRNGISGEEYPAGSFGLVFLWKTDVN